ncbi:FHA domain-containing protein [Plantibacter sp. VKM Ac-2885]|uniref:FHA domain-containing protein n=2 Tax=Plantibacter TaxID=190323 RepID=UPI0017831A2F|nr:FHA domain-containing protein [Plantibacter sp. CFBP 8804]MBF4512136.1 FHA domain-containing protein [Plantibacter sp. VKM Ac-2885]
MYSYEMEPAEVRRWLAVAGPGRLVLVDAQGDDTAAAAFAADLPGDASLSLIVDRLAAGGLSNTPAFAAAVWDGSGATVIVRGLAAAVVTSAAGTETVLGARATTWVEEHHADAVSVTLRSDQPNPSGVRLPLGSGAVWTTSITATLDEEATASLATPTTDERRPTESSTSTPTAAEQLAAPPVPAPAEPAASAATSDDADDETDGDEATPVAHVEPVQPLHVVPSVSDTQFFHDEDDPDETPSTPEEPVDEGYDFLFGQTVLRPVGAAAVDEAGDAERAAAEASAHQQAAATAVAAPEPAAAGPSDLGDHDGHTILAEDLAALRARRAAETPPARSSTPSATPLTYLELPGGTRQSLASPVVLGRAPSVSQVPASVVPTLVTLTGDDISRSHVRVAVEGGTVVVTDLHSRNGTQVVLPGQAPQSLRPGEPTPVIVGTVIDLGGGVALRVREG